MFSQERQEGFPVESEARFCTEFILSALDNLVPGGLYCTDTAVSV